MTVSVKTLSEFRKAVKGGEEEIIVEGSLADKLKNSKSIALLGTAGISALTIALGAATVAAPITGGLSYFAAASVAALSGAEIVAIIAASTIGISLVLAVFKDYNEIDYQSGRLKLRKK